MRWIAATLALGVLTAVVVFTAGGGSSSISSNPAAPRQDDALEALIPVGEDPRTEVEVASEVEVLGTIGSLPFPGGDGLVGVLFGDEGSPFSLFDLATYPPANLPTLENLERFMVRWKVGGDAKAQALEAWKDADRRAAWARMTEIQALSQFVAAHSSRTNARIERGEAPVHLAVEVVQLGGFLSDLGIDSAALFGGLDAEALRTYTESIEAGAAAEDYSSLAPEARELLRLLTQSWNTVATSRLVPLSPHRK